MDVALDDGSGGTTTDGIFQRSLEEFKANLTDAQRESFPEYTIRHVKLKILDIQRYQERVRSMMNFPRIKSFLERFGDIDALCRQERVAGNVSGEISGFIWGATSYILQVAQEDNAILSIVLDAYQAFGKRIPVIHPHLELIQAHSNEMRCLAYIYQDLLRVYAKMIKLLTGRGWKKTFNVDWTDYKNQFDTILTSLDDHGSILTDLSRAWQSQKDGNYMNGNLLSWSGACRQLMLRYDQKRNQKLFDAKEAEDRRRKEHTREVLQWLRPSSGHDQESRHNKYKEVREEFPDTSHWILRENKMDNWINEEIPPQSIMWLHGKKGAGKTILASTIIDGCAATPEFTTTYFYCREDDPGLNTAAAVLKDILRQLLKHNQGPLPSCRNKKINGGEEVLTNIDTIKALLELFCESDMKQFVVIDGLDECPMPEVKAIVKFWTTVVDKCDEYKPGKLRVLFLSHENDDIRKLMQKAAIFDLTPDQSADDIDKYLTTRFKKLQQKWASKGHHLGDGETHAAKQTILRLCQGSFLYAHLTMGHLFWQQTIQAVRGEMRERMLPSDLGKAYEKTINRLEKDLGHNDMRWHMAKKVFSLLAGAARPLKWHELQAALSFESRGVTTTYQELERNIEVICGGLVQRLENRVEFIHSTTKWNVLRSRHLSRERVYCDMAVLCLRYLSSWQFKHELDEQQVEHAVIAGSYSFQDYAVSKWNSHLEMLIGYPFGNFFIENGREETNLSGALADFLMFHRESIKLAEEKKQSAGKESHLSPRSSQNQARQSRSPRSSQQSLSSRSPTPSQPGRQEQEEMDPADNCKPFVGRSFYSNLVEVWTHIANHRKAGWKEKYKVSLPNLDAALENARRKIESLADRYKANRDEASIEHLVKLYGERYFKCQRITCDFFHEGFETKSELDSHSNRHDRPYHCPDESCSLQPFGFSTNKDRDKHIRNYHPERSGDPAHFKIGTANGKQATAEAKYKCTICTKSFTRQSILKEHTDAHYGERKHACETCGKRFTRANDRNRHRKIHVRRARGA